MTIKYLKLEFPSSVELKKFAMQNSQWYYAKSNASFTMNNNVLFLKPRLFKKCDLKELIDDISEVELKEL